MAEINLSLLPKPDIIEALDFETIFARRKAKFISLWPANEQPDWEKTLLLESEPVTKLLQESAYMELLLRQRINNAAHASMLAFAKGHDLDNLAANFGTKRLILTPADDSVVPPKLAVYESDEDLRYRCQLAFEGLTTAGPINSYKYHGLSADGNVKDINVLSPSPGDVLLPVLSRLGDGTASQTLLFTVLNACNAENVRPLCDSVSVQSAHIIPYTITATLTLYPSATESVTLDASRQAINHYTHKHHALGRDITLSGINHALRAEGVQNVDISQPAADIVVNEMSAAFCTNITVNVGGRDE